MADDITRKDFLNAVLLGTGASLLGASAPGMSRVIAAAAGHAERVAPAPDNWTGPGGVGDYAASNGNTKPVMDAAHAAIRDVTAKRPPSAADTGEAYDLVVVGGGITGLTAAYFFARQTGNAKTCLVIDDHPIFGGEAKQNEFVVNGVHLIAPQGSNDFGVPRAGSGWQDDVWTDLNMPRQFTFSRWESSEAELRFAQDNYQPMEGVGEYGTDIAYFFGARGWHRNIWQNDLADAPFTDDVKRDLVKWRNSAPVTNGLAGEQFARFLDTMSYKQYLENVAGYKPEATKMIEPVVGLISGASPDAVSAHAAQQIGMPGVSRPRGRNSGAGLSFPGGNVTYGRHLVKKLIPESITGDFTFDGVLDGHVNWAALDRSGQPTRVRVGATVVRVEHANGGVRVTYAKDGKVYRVNARRVAMATGGWVNKRVIADVPADIATAYDDFRYAPALIINVALTNWRFLYKLGATAARWFDDGALGFVANIRRQMTTRGYTAPLDPDKPTVLTFYMGLYAPGKPAYEQGVTGRTTLLSTSFASYERTLRAQLRKQFASSGFDDKRDIAGIILNRWGHARLVQPPGWYYGRNGATPSREIVAKGFGQIAIGHSELNGHQSATGAMTQGKRLGEWAAGN